MKHIKTFDQLSEAVSTPGKTNFVEIAACTKPVDVSDLRFRLRGQAGSPENPLMETVSVEPFTQKKSYADDTYQVDKLYLYRIAYSGERYANSEFPQMMLFTVDYRGGDFWTIKYDVDAGSVFAPYPVSKMKAPAPIVKLMSSLDGSMSGTPLLEVRTPLKWSLVNNPGKYVNIFFDELGRAIVENHSRVQLPNWDGRVVNDTEIKRFFSDGGRWDTMNEQLMSFDVEKLAAAAREIKHCGDYGRLFIKEGSADVFWTAGDADSSDGFDDEDEIKHKLMAVDGVESVEVQAEATPDPDSGWMEIDYSSEN